MECSTQADRRAAAGGRPGRWEFLALVAGSLMVPLAPARPVETAFAACVFGVAYGYLRLRAAPRSVAILGWALGAVLASLAIAALVAAKADFRWSSGAAWLAMLLGLTAGWGERERWRA